MKIKAITFDYWDTLVPIDRDKIEKMREQRAKALSEFFKKYGYNLSPNDVKKISNEIWEIYKDNPLTNREVTLHMIVEEILGKIGVRKEREMIKKIVEIYEDFLYKAGLCVDKDVIPVLKYLKEKGLKLGIISNTPGGNVERKILKDADVIDYFDIMLFSSFEGIRKPHPRIFLNAIEFFKIKPEELLHIGDTPKLDIEGPLKIGANALLWNPKGNKVNVKYIKKWEELKNTLKGKI